MRFLMATMLLAAFLVPANASDARDQCNYRCGLEYQTCLKRARTKAAKKSCAVFRKTCRRGCVGR